jgi:hypothetical protein
MALTALSNTGISLIGPLTKPKGADEGPSPTGRAEFNAQWERISAALAAMHQLKDDWDGQGASAPEPANVEHALQWVEQMQRNNLAIPPSQAVSGVNGEVLLIWQSDDFFLEAEIDHPARVEWMLSITDRPTKHWVTDATIPYFVGSTQ